MEDCRYDGGKTSTATEKKYLPETAEEPVAE